MVIKGLLVEGKGRRLYLVHTQKNDVATLTLDYNSLMLMYIWTVNEPTCHYYKLVTCNSYILALLLLHTRELPGFIILWTLCNFVTIIYYHQFGSNIIYTKCTNINIKVP